MILLHLWMALDMAVGVPAAPAPSGAEQPSSPAAAADAEPMAGPLLPLDEAIAVAARGNRGLAIAGTETLKAEDRVAAARTRRWPSLQLDVFESKLLGPIEFTFERGSFGTFGSTGPVPAENTTLRTKTGFSTLVSAQLSQPLTQLHRIGLGVEFQGVGERLARERERAERIAVATNVRQAWLGIVAAQASLRSRRDSVAFLEELERLVTKTVAQEASLRADLLDVRARLARERHEATLAEDLVANRKEQLNLLLGRDVLTPFSVPDAPADPADDPMTIESAREEALAHRSEIAQARFNRDQADLDRRLKKAEYIPDVSLAVNWFRLYQEDVIPPDIAGAGVLLRWEPFDYGRKSRELAEKTRTVEQAARAEEQTRSAVLVEVDAAFRQMREARELERVAVAAQEAARERLRVEKERYARQASLLKDLLQAQAVATDADASLAAARAGWWSSSAAFEQAIGRE